MALSRRSIVEAGLGILDEYGLGDLSMRRVADALGVQAGALYYHVPNKQSLLAAVADEILAAAVADGAPGPGAVAEWLSEWARGLRRALLQHRDAAELVSSAHALGLGAVDPCAAGQARLEAALAHEPAATMAALLHFVLGHVMEEQTRAQMHQLGVVSHFDAADATRTFEWGLALFISGVDSSTVRIGVGPGAMR
ncbi:TetR family transcriptional regulator [Tessaracoccus sp. MC1679]|uniref:TetR/AcrR family transcriptional regulator C-terminal domain-containing protein n=1 Tax=Tessaracoccus sp. MC1679 TaxID=2760313 RepID=UPI0015FF848F|nr:TetR family transcriptional regulator [Tessaracoccus sp. MC1679]